MPVIQGMLAVSKDGMQVFLAQVVLHVTPSFSVCVVVDVKHTSQFLLGIMCFTIFAQVRCNRLGLVNSLSCCGSASCSCHISVINCHLYRSLADLMSFHQMLNM